MTDQVFQVPILLPANPTLGLHAATKQYVDGLFNSDITLNGNLTFGPTKGITGGLNVTGGPLSVSGLISATNFSGTSLGTNTGDQTTITGNAGTASKLFTPRLINGVSFDGSANITIPPNLALSDINSALASGNGPIVQGASYSTTSANLTGGILIKQSGGTITDNSTATSGTVASAAANIFGQQTIAAVNQSVTYTNAYTTYIAGAPIAGSNVGILNTWSLYVNSGNSYFGGIVTLGGSLHVPNAGTIQTTYGGKLFTSANGATWEVSAGDSGSNSFIICDYTKTAQWTWDQNQNLTTTKTIGTGAATVTTSGSTSSLTVQDTGTTGVNVLLVGNGTTTPNKTLRVHSGNLEFINSAYSAVVATLTDVGGLTLNGGLIVGGATTHNGTLNSYINTDGATIAATNTNYVTVQSNSTSAAHILFIRNSAYAFRVGMDTDNQLKIGGFSMGAVSYRIVHEGLTAVSLAGTISATTVTSSGQVFAGVNFTATTTAAYLNCTGAGTVGMRPNGQGSSTGQLIVDSTGAVTANGVVNSLGLALGNVVASAPQTVTNHLALYGASYGLSVTNNTVNYVSGGGFHHFINSTGAYAQLTGSAFVVGSDVALKQDIRDLKHRGPLRPRAYTMIHTGAPAVGFVAQEVQVSYPEAVKRDHQTGLLGVDYGMLTAVLSVQVNTVEEELVIAKQQVDFLTGQVNDLLARMDRQEKKQ